MIIIDITFGFLKLKPMFSVVECFVREPMYSQKLDYGWNIQIEEILLLLLNEWDMSI